MRPATERQISVELENLRAVFGYEETAWATASGIYIDALSDIPHDLLAYAVATYCRLAGPEDRFPKPGQLRFLVSDRLDGRKRDAQRERHPPSTESWPDWLADLWGPEPQGPIKRDTAGRARDDAFHEAALWRQNGRPLLPQGTTVSDWIAAGKPEEIRGRRVAFGDNSAAAASSSDADAMRDLQEVLGVKSLELGLTE